MVAWYLHAKRNSLLYVYICAFQNDLCVLFLNYVESAALYRMWTRGIILMFFERLFQQ